MTLSLYKEDNTSMDASKNNKIRKIDKNDVATVGEPMTTDSVRSSLRRPLTRGRLMSLCSVGGCEQSNHPVIDKSRASSRSRLLSLRSPVGGPPLIYGDDHFQKGKQEASASEIWTAIEWAAIELKHPSGSAILDLLSQHKIVTADISYDRIRTLCVAFNKLVEQPCEIQASEVSVPLLRFIMEATYRNAVDEPELLNSYRPFSDQTYGETFFDMIQQLVEFLQISDKDVFIDLGSGIGNVVLTVAALARCSEVYGIEMAETPNKYAQRMVRAFRNWMDWFGKTYSPFKLMEGDFFSTRFKDTIRKSNIIFVNNFGFSARTEHDLKTIFGDMPEGTRVISTKAFVSPLRNINNRRLDDLSAIAKIQEIEPRSSMPVSWTRKPVSFFCQTIDRTELEAYFTRNKQRQPLKRIRRDTIVAEKDAESTATKPVMFPPNRRMTISFPVAKSNDTTERSTRENSPSRKPAPKEIQKTVKMSPRLTRARRKTYGIDLFNTNKKSVPSTEGDIAPVPAPRPYANVKTSYIQGPQPRIRISKLPLNPEDYHCPERVNQAANLIRSRRQTVCEGPTVNKIPKAVVETNSKKTTVRGPSQITKPPTPKLKKPKKRLSKRAALTETGEENEGAASTRVAEGCVGAVISPVVHFPITHELTETIPVTLHSAQVEVVKHLLKLTRAEERLKLLLLKKCRGLKKTMLMWQKNMVDFAFDAVHCNSPKISLTKLRLAQEQHDVDNSVEQSTENELESVNDSSEPLPVVQPEPQPSPPPSITPVINQAPFNEGVFLDAFKSQLDCPNTTNLKTLAFTNIDKMSPSCVKQMVGILCEYVDRSKPWIDLYQTQTPAPRVKRSENDPNTRPQIVSQALTDRKTPSKSVEPLQHFPTAKLTPTKPKTKFGPFQSRPPTAADGHNKMLLIDLTNDIENSDVMPRKINVTCQAPKVDVTKRMKNIITNAIADEAERSSRIAAHTVGELVNSEIERSYQSSQSRVTDRRTNWPSSLPISTSTHSRAPIEPKRRRKVPSATVVREQTVPVEGLAASLQQEYASESGPFIHDYEMSSGVPSDHEYARMDMDSHPMLALVLSETATTSNENRAPTTIDINEINHVSMNDQSGRTTASVTRVMTTPGIVPSSNEHSRQHSVQTARNNINAVDDSEPPSAVWVDDINKNFNHIFSMVEEGLNKKKPAKGSVVIVSDDDNERHGTDRSRSANTPGRNSYKIKNRTLHARTRPYGTEMIEESAFRPEPIDGIETVELPRTPSPRTSSPTVRAISDMSATFYLPTTPPAREMSPAVREMSPPMDDNPPLTPSPSNVFNVTDVYQTPRMPYPRLPLANLIRTAYRSDVPNASYTDEVVYTRYGEHQTYHVYKRMVTSTVETFQEYTEER